MTNTDKQNIINAFNTKDGDEFLVAALTYLSKIEQKLDLNDFVTALGGIYQNKNISNSQRLTELALLLRDRVYELLIANGDVPENDYINLYYYFRHCALPVDDRWAAYEKFVDENLYAEGISDTERVFLLVLRFFASFANSREYAFERFFTDVTRLNLISAGSVGFSQLVTQFFDFGDIAIDEIIELMRSLWQKERYFELSKEERRSLFNWSLHSLWLVRAYFSHPKWMELYGEWKEIFYEHIARDECDEAMYVQFFIYHKMGNSFQTQAEWRMFNEEIDRPASEYYKKWCERANLPKCKTSVSDGKKIIGFLWDRFVMNSPFKVAYSLWKALLQNEEFRARYEIKVYLMSYFEKSTNDIACIEMTEKLGISVWDGAEPFYKDGFYHSHLQKALDIRQKIIDDGVDILIHGGCYDINDFLVASRVAPRQIYWSHGNHEYNIDGIDKRISHCSLEGCAYNFESFAVPMDIEKFYNPHRDPRLIEQERAKYPKDAFVLGVIGRLVKIDSDEYLETIAKIMHQNPNTIFIAAGSGNVESIKSKVEKLGIADRFYMPGYVDPHIYGHIIDLFCDTFPLPQGESLYEFMFKGCAKTFVSLKDQSYLETCEALRQQMLEIETKFCEDPLFCDFKKHLNSVCNDAFYVTYIADCVQNYIEKVSRNIRDQKLREGINYYFIKFYNYETKQKIKRLVCEL